jgi:hypothetical protein
MQHSVREADRRRGEYRVPNGRHDADYHYRGAGERAGARLPLPRGDVGLDFRDRAGGVEPRAPRFSVVTSAARSGPNIPGRRAVLANERAARMLHLSFSARFRRWWAAHLLFARAFADPVDDLFVGRLGGGDALEQAGVGIDVWRSPLQAVGVAGAGGEHEVGALVGVGHG